MFLIPAVLALIGGGAWLLSQNSSAPAATVPPKGVITPERDAIYQTAMASVTDVQNLKDLSASFAAQDLPAQAASLLAKANSILAANPNAGNPINLGNPAPAPINLGQPAPVISQTPSQGGTVFPGQSDPNVALMTATAVANGFSPNPAVTDIVKQAIAALTSMGGPPSILTIQQTFNRIPQPGIGRLVEDGLPGPNTNQAIVRFQANNGINEAPGSLSPQGNIASVGPMTALAIREVAQPTHVDAPDPTQDAIVATGALLT